MRLAEDKGRIYWKRSKRDIFNRKFIMMNSKLVDEAANNWFRSYLRRYKDININTLETVEPDRLEQIRKKALDHFAEYGLTDENSGVYLMTCSSLDTTTDKGERKYTLKNRKGEQMIFSSFNGYWYESEDHPEFIFFDYGDFYCMSAVFPLAYTAYLCKGLI